ncbi:hypothetical protein [Streptomyces achromogenes]|uniref:hypothetical protein n=1 Tax=Streptomyces achromogenes TaxID=67255 RepID=UPI00341DB65E
MTTAPSTSPFYSLRTHTAGVNPCLTTTSGPTGAHPWQGWTFSAGWGTQRALDVLLVEPAVVMETAVDIARDSAGRWRHPARPHRIRTDLDVTQVPLLGEDPASL